MEKEFYEEIREIYDLLQDDLSKRIFAGRLLYSLTHDMRYMLDVVCTTHAGKSIYTRMKCNDKKKIIFGAGVIGKRLVDIFYDVDFECFADNNHAGDTCKGLPIINVETLKERYQNDLIIIATVAFHNEIEAQLLKYGFKKDNIINIGKENETLSRLQYFDLPELNSATKNKEIFVDGGCYDGASSIEFKKWCNNSGVKESFVYAWEPDPKNLELCKLNLEKNQIQNRLINKGLYNKPDHLCFEMAETASTISENGSIHIEVDSIDNVINSPVTFIKMDIEGAEYKALLGAEKTIKKYKPKLAICIYHKPEDVWEIPMLIHKINPNYRFYVRHYSLTTPDTILYAIDESDL